MQDKFGVRSLRDRKGQMMGALYLQVSIVSQALIFVTRSRRWSFVESPGLLLVTVFIIAQMVATLIVVYANWGFARIQGIGWGWAGVIWLYSIVFYIPIKSLTWVESSTRPKPSNSSAWNLLNAKYTSWKAFEASLLRSDTVAFTGKTTNSAGGSGPTIPGTVGGR
ncbi:hypothetical protein HRI_000313700 [Hibiscus trionum]|uniref:Uncharacterized protein n=1 Tax=Hibiscus trionum TaxID=183268 RepID=A0A9W7GVN1_HIBTR|nr:hypothetical protein HRI_000313700 [Hibiscus trionum]